MEDFEFYEEEFVDYLKNRNCNDRTINKRISVLKTFFKAYKVLNDITYNDYYEDITDRLKPASVNSCVIALNLYVLFLEKKFNVKLENMCAKTVRVRKVQFLDEVCSLDDYLFFMNKAKARNKDKLYIACKIMATTGMRIHELFNIRREHIEIGFIDFLGKGGKERRCYFTPTTQNEVLEILDKHHITNKSDYIISSYWSGQRLTWKNERVLQRTITNFAESECEFEKGLFHAHMFRHFFAKNFIKKHQNIALLADLLGHSNIETTRIYLKYTAKEQQDIVNQVVTW